MTTRTQVEMDSCQMPLRFARTIRQAFLDFDEAHPEVFRYIVARCHDLQEAGISHYGMKGIYERCRWHYRVERRAGEEFKLNNNFTAHYARKLIAEYPQFADLFEIRELRAE